MVTNTDPDVIAKENSNNNNSEKISDINTPIVESDRIHTKQETDTIALNANNHYRSLGKNARNYLLNS